MEKKTAVDDAGHGVFDFSHHLFIKNPGVPVWWPGFCLSFDVLAGGFLAMLLNDIPDLLRRFSTPAAILRHA